MADIVMGATTQKGCSFCGKDIPKALGGRTWILKGSNGRVAFCCQNCGRDYEAKEGEVEPESGGSDGAASSKKRRKAKLK